MELPKVLELRSRFTILPSPIPLRPVRLASRVSDSFVWGFAELGAVVNDIFYAPVGDQI